MKVKKDTKKKNLKEKQEAKYLFIFIVYHAYLLNVVISVILDVLHLH